MKGLLHSVFYLTVFLSLHNVILCKPIPVNRKLTSRRSSPPGTSTEYTSQASKQSRTFEGGSSSHSDLHFVNHDYQTPTLSLSNFPAHREDFDLNVEADDVEPSSSEDEYTVVTNVVPFAVSSPTRESQRPSNSRRRAPPRKEKASIQTSDQDHFHSNKGKGKSTSRYKKLAAIYSEQSNYLEQTQKGKEQDEETVTDSTPSTWDERVATRNENVRLAKMILGEIKPHLANFESMEVGAARRKLDGIVGKHKEGRAAIGAIKKFMRKEWETQNPAEDLPAFFLSRRQGQLEHQNRNPEGYERYSEAAKMGHQQRKGRKGE